ncbi:lipid IV(A) 3-deoxy-D-manno-octulosonic acid transferase [Herbaspirillum sp. NPDC101397]|uniref:lipid IV(A) 3-deoxy-D-manno-octulosonic acid transferase n=1 Tax=Herbaspirillum sp. NPDC101397 TaxID=3364006 RepID=UPI00383AF863
MRLIYSALWWAALPFVLLRLWRRGIKEPGYRQHLGERLGFYRQFRGMPLPPLIWVHAVSVGETRAAQPLIEALLQAYPRHTVLLTHMTATGRATGQQLFEHHSNRVVQSFFPYDTGWMCSRFLRYFKPQISILMETEVWPNMVRQCKRHHVPVMLANARLSERSLRRGQRFGAILLEASASIDCVAAQSEDDAERLRSFGARQVQVTGSIKFDVNAPPEMVARGVHWRAGFGERPVLLCASTREGEERLIIDALASIKQRDFLTMIVPRHPQRFNDVAALIESSGLSFLRRSDLKGALNAREVDIVLGDSMGEMFAYYAACDVAFIGGSLLPFGGQNLIEACSLSKPVLLGQHTFNFHAISDTAVAEGAAARVVDATDMLYQARMIATNSELRATMAQHAVAFARRHQGATERTMKILGTILNP